MPDNVLPSGSPRTATSIRSSSRCRVEAYRWPSRSRRELGAPLDVIVVRKLGVPFQPELGMGAVGENGVRVLNENVMRLAGVGKDELANVEARERAEVEVRARRFRGDRAPVPLCRTNRHHR